MNCPRCGVPLVVGNTARATLFGCSACGGVWLDMTTAHRLCEVLDADAATLLDSASRYASHRVDVSLGIACPQCGQALCRARIPNAGVDIDYCGQHGTWFDKDELPKIAQAAAVQKAYGGLPPQEAPAQTSKSTPSTDDDSGSEAGYVAAEIAGGIAFGLLEGLFDSLFD
jgi:Zn-finger nucleic acid-binding protein